MADWRPAAKPELLRLRAETLARLRRFFAARQVLEVETPLLAPATVTDVHIDSIPAELQLPGSSTRFFLQTSPEYAMKRLLAAGTGACYQICKSFRQGEAGARHNPEFTMLEWYRPGFDLVQLMDEVEQLLLDFVPQASVVRLSYRQVFLRHLEIDPHEIRLDALRELAGARLSLDGSALAATDCLQLLLAQIIEPLLPEFCFIHDYPADQAALAKIERDRSGVRVARRFELFCCGIELANGYHEELDAGELRTRFARDRQQRAQLGRTTPAPDEKLLAALEQGLPPCAGVALGVDRLLMLVAGAGSINEVLAFPIGRV